MKVVLCLPTLTRPYQQTLDAIAASVPLMDAAGFDHNMVSEIGCPYISAARATMLRKALDAKADVIVFIDHDLSWRPADLVTLIQTPGDVVAGLYRFKKDGEAHFMGVLDDDNGGVKLRDDGCIKAHAVPAGFLKITPKAVDRFMQAYPDLSFGPRWNPSTDLFNHGAHAGQWWGEDYAFSRRWRELGGELWVVPDLTLTHHTSEAAYEGNFHQFMLRQPGGAECSN